MSLNDATSGERIHIGFFGLRNAGKSSTVNAVTGQDLAVVSDVAGTTTDPVRKAMELLPLGPVLVIDTPGLDDAGKVGDLRVRKARRVIDSTDIAVLVVDSTKGMAAGDRELVDLFNKRGVPHVIAMNKSDLSDIDVGAVEIATDAAVPHARVNTDAVSGAGIHELKETLGKLAVGSQVERYILSDLIEAGDDIVLVPPIDSAAPKGRLILPQQMTIRDILDSGAHAHVTRETELESMLASLARPPRLVVTDSQAFGVVSKIVPEDVPLTSFSILMSRYKGDLDAQVENATALDDLADGDKVLLAEGCTHHCQCQDIGTVKLPKWISDYAGCDIAFEFTSGGEFPDDLSAYALVVHCGGCMLNEREMRWRLRHAAAQGIPCTNYGMAIAKVNGILDRALAPLIVLRS